ncbi:glycerophosphodiester phosphodiesterase family protein [Providencia rettgeri]
MREVKPTQKPAPSSDIKDLFFNSGLLDIWATSLERKYIDRFGNCHLTAAGMEWLFKELVEKFKIDMNTAIVAAGYITIDSFQQGADLPNNELTQRNHILRDETTGEYYRWDGDLPKQVPAGSTPQSTGGIGKVAWVSVGDASLRGDLAGIDGASIIRTKNKTSVQDALNGLEESDKKNNNTIRMGINATGRPLIVNAHRGYSETYFEQTLLAFSQCRADALEIDMQMTKDGVAVCFHDDDLSIQTVTGVGAIKDHDASIIESLRYKRAVGTRYEDMVQIPRLGVVCKMAARRGKKLLAEIKGYRTIDDCIQYNTIITSYGLAPTTTYICFDFAPLRLIREINNESTFGWIINSYNSGMDATIEELASWGGGVISINRNALQNIGYGRLRYWESLGLTIQVWTIYTMQQLQEVLDYGVRNVTLDKDFASILNN